MWLHTTYVVPIPFSAVVHLVYSRDHVALGVFACGHFCYVLCVDQFIASVATTLCCQAGQHISSLLHQHRGLWGCVVVNLLLLQPICYSKAWLSTCELDLQCIVWCTWCIMHTCMKVSRPNSLFCCPKGANDGSTPAREHCSVL